MGESGLDPFEFEPAMFEGGLFPLAEGLGPGPAFLLGPSQDLLCFRSGVSDRVDSSSTEPRLVTVPGEQKSNCSSQEDRQTCDPHAVHGCCFPGAHPDRRQLDQRLTGVRDSPKVELG